MYYDKQNVEAPDDLQLVQRNQCLDLLFGASIPLEHVCYAFAYGSGAIPQQGEDVNKKMVDFLLVCNDSRKFHERNLQINSSHYSFPFRNFYHSDKMLDSIYKFQRDQFVCLKGARVFYNTMVVSRDRRIKYGIIETNDFLTDLLHWRWLYVAGRMHKPVLEVIAWPNNDGLGQKPDLDIRRAINLNHIMATQAALLMMPEKFSMNDFLCRIVSHSYKGDVRMGWAEDRKKILKLVAGADDRLRKIYKPILCNEKMHFGADDLIEQDCSIPTIARRLQMLPQSVRYGLCINYNLVSSHQLWPFCGFGYVKNKNTTTIVLKDLTLQIAKNSSAKDLATELDKVLVCIVRRSSWHQSLKNALTAGVGRSIRYMMPKLLKGLRYWK